MPSLYSGKVRIDADGRMWACADDGGDDERGGVHLANNFSGAQEDDLDVAAEEENRTGAPTNPSPASSPNPVASLGQQQQAVGSTAHTSSQRAAAGIGGGLPFGLAEFSSRPGTVLWSLDDVPQQANAQLQQQQEHQRQQQQQQQDSGVGGVNADEASQQQPAAKKARTSTGSAGSASSLVKNKAPVPVGHFDEKKAEESDEVVEVIAPAGTGTGTAAAVPAAAAAPRYSGDGLRGRKMSDRDGCVVPAIPAERDENGGYKRPPGRGRKGMKWNSTNANINQPQQATGTPSQGRKWHTTAAKKNAGGDYRGVWNPAPPVIGSRSPGGRARGDGGRSRRNLNHPGGGGGGALAMSGHADGKMGVCADDDGDDERGGVHLADNFSGAQEDDSDVAAEEENRTGAPTNPSPASSPNPVFGLVQEQLDIERARADNAEKELAEAKIQIAAMQEQGLEAGLENLQPQDDAAEMTAASLETTASAAKFNAFLGQFVLLSSEKAPLLDRKNFISDSVFFGDVDKYGPLFLFSCSILYYTKEHRTLAQANGTWPSLNSFLDTFASGVNPVSQEHIMRKGGEYGKRGLKSPNETSRRKGWKKDAKKVVDAIKVKVAEGGVADASDLHGALFKIERAVNSVFDDNQFDSHGFGDVPEAPRRSFCLLLAAIHVRSNKQYAHNEVSGANSTNHPPPPPQPPVRHQPPVQHPPPPPPQPLAQPPPPTNQPQQANGTPSQGRAKRMIKVCKRAAKDPSLGSNKKRTYGIVKRDLHNRENLAYNMAKDAPDTALKDSDDEGGGEKKSESQEWVEEAVEEYEEREEEETRKGRMP